MAFDSTVLSEEIRNVSLEAFLKQFPAQTYATTLINKYGRTVLGDVFDETLKDCKKLSELRNFIVSNVSSIIVPPSGPVVIPVNVASTPLDTLRQFVVEYADSITKKNPKNTFKKYYLHPGGPMPRIYEMEELASILKLTKERIRQIIAGESENCRKLLLGNEVNGLIAEPELVKWFSDIDSKINSVISIDELRRLTGTSGKDVFLERFLFDVLDLSVCKDKNLPEIAYRSSLNLKDFVREIGVVIRYFRDAALPVTEEDFKDFLAIKYKKKEIVKTALMDYVNTVSDFEKTFDAEGTKYIALKWEYLEFLPSEVARLLYDNKVFTAKDAWSRNQIANAYNAKAKLYGIEPMDRNAPNIFKHKAVLALGKSGMYRLVAYPGEKFTSGKDFAIEFVKKYGAAAKSDAFYDECKKNGYDHIYDDNSLGAYFSGAYNAYMKGMGKAADYIPIEKMVEYAANTLLSLGGTAFISKLQREIEAKYGISVGYSSLKQALVKADDLFELCPSGKKLVNVKLLVSSISTIDFTKYVANSKTRKPAPYRSIIVATAVDELRSAPGHTMPLAELTKKLKSLIPSDLATNNVYKIFLDDKLFVKTSCGKNRFNVSLNPETYKEEYVDKATPAESPDKTVAVKVETDTKPFTWDRLRTHICAQYKYLENYTGTCTIDQMANRMYKIMCDGESSVMPGSEFYKLLSLLYTLYTSATSINDRELLCLKTILGMEPYLKSLHRLHNGYEMTCSGLGTAINYLEKVGLLPDKYAYDKLGSEISDKTGRIITRRNNLHENFEGKANDAMNMFNIDAFMKYYLLVAAYSIKKKS